MIRKILVFVAVPLLACGYVAYTFYQKEQNKLSNAALAKAIERYKRDQKGWPQDFSGLEPYVDQPEALRLMNPRFMPVSEREAYMEENVWTSTKTQRQSFRVIVNSNGSCSLHPTSPM